MATGQSRRGAPRRRGKPCRCSRSTTPGKGFRVSVKGRLYFSRKGKVKSPVRHGHCSQQTHSALLQTASSEGKLNPVPQPSADIRTSEPKLLLLLYAVFKETVTRTEIQPKRLRESSERQENFPPTSTPSAQERLRTLDAKACVIWAKSKPNTTKTS